MIHPGTPLAIICADVFFAGLKSPYSICTPLRLAFSRTRENSQIPVITGGIGICHIFVDESANLEKALPVIHNAKTQRPSVCNALDTVLVHRAVAANFLPRIVDHLIPAGVSFRAHESAIPYLAGKSVEPAGPDDFDTEWMSLGLRYI